MARLERFWDVICDYRSHLWLGVMVFIFLFVLTVISMAFGTPGTAPFTLAIVNLGMILAGGLFLGALFYVCMRRQQKQY